jgi:flotillin
MQAIGFVVVIVLLALVFIPLIVSTFLHNVEAGTIRIVSWLQGSTAIYRGPGKSREIPLFTTGTTISSRAINVDLDITDQTADVDERGVPKPIKVRILASAIVSVGDSDALIKTAANRFFAKPEEEQLSTLIDLLSSSGRRAVNLLTHDQLFSAKTAPPTPSGNGDGTPHATIDAAEDDDDPLAIIIRKACSRELTDLGLIFNSLNIKVVQSEVADARRRQSPVGSRSAGRGRHRGRAANAPRQRSSARSRAADLRQAARSGANARRQRGSHRAGRGQKAGRARQPARIGVARH